MLASPPVITAKSIGEWLAQRVVLGIVIVCILVGSLYANANSTAPQTLSVGKRAVSQLTAVFVMALIAGYIFDNTDWNPWVQCILGVASGIASDFCLRWILAWFQNSDGFAVFFGRISEVAKAAYAAWNSVKNKP